MEPTLSHTIAVLSRTPAALNALLRDLPDFWIFRNEGGETFTAFDVIGHLNHGERADWMVRAKIILQHGESQPFPKFDRHAQVLESQGKSLAELLDDFAGLRAKNLDDLRALNLQPEDFHRRGQHPALGPVTLDELLCTWAAHDLTHLHQLSRLLAYQYRESVGPWSRYLGVMHCNGHSE